MSLSVSSDGLTLLAGAYEHSSEFNSGGRIEMIDTQFEVGIEALGQAENDAFGFSVSMSGNAETIAAIRTSDGILEIFDENFNLRQEIDAGFVSFTSVFRVSRDGKWIVIAGDEAISFQDNVLKAKVYRLDESSLLFEQHGSDIEIQTASIFGTYMIDFTSDGSAFVVSTVGGLQFDQVGSFWVYGRGDGLDDFALLGEREISSEDDDGFGQSVGIVVMDSGDLLVAVGIPMTGKVATFIFRGGKWKSHIEIEAGPEFNPDSDFGYAIAMNQNGSRIAVGARCYAEASSDGCDGAVQAYDIVGKAIFPVGSLLAGPPYSFFGEAVAMSAKGNRLVVGAPEDCIDFDCSGSVYVFAASDP